MVVGTPSRVLTHLRDKVREHSTKNDISALPTFPHAQSLHLKDSLETLVVDEADLVFSYGYEDDIKAVLR